MIKIFGKCHEHAKNVPLTHHQHHKHFQLLALKMRSIINWSKSKLVRVAHFSSFDYYKFFVFCRFYNILEHLIMGLPHLTDVFLFNTNIKFSKLW